MHTVNFEEALEAILQRDSRYHRDAYLFIREALDHTQKMMGKASKNEVRHVSGKELLEGIKEYALAQYGPMTLTVLESWGVHRGEDFGQIVFNMVETNLLAKTDQDTPDDFKDGYDFVEAFQKPFLPASRKSPPVDAPSNTQA